MRTILAALLAFAVVGHASAYHSDVQGKALKLDTLEIKVRSNAPDFGFKVGHLWDCIGKSEGKGRVVKRTGNDVREIVRVEAGGELLDFHFRLTDNSALLERITSDGMGIQDWNELLQFVARAGACK